MPQGERLVKFGEIVRFDGSEGAICEDGTQEEFLFFRSQWRALVIARGDVRFGSETDDWNSRPRNGRRAVFSVKEGKGAAQIECVGPELAYNQLGQRLMQDLKEMVLATLDDPLKGWQVALALRHQQMNSEKRIKQALMLLLAEGKIFQGDEDRWQKCLPTSRLTGIRTLAPANI